MTQQNTGNGSSMMVQGRLVWGEPFTGKKKTNDQNQPVLDQAGQQVIEFGFGLAVPKYDRNGQPTAEFTKIWQALHQEAFTLYPSGQIPADFAYKYKDGDGVDHNGKPFADREGYKGHLILNCTTQIPIKGFKWDGVNNLLVNTGIKTGDYVEVQLNIKAHPPKGRGKPGLYLNPSAVRLIQEGQAIINTPSGDQLFGTAAPAYAGEVIPHSVPSMNMNPVPPMGAPAPVAPMPNYAPQPGYAPQAPVAPAPYHNVLPPNHQPAPVAPMPGQYAPQPGYAPQAPQAPAPGGYAMPPMPGMPR